jgi:hypothetical protein
MHGHTLILDFLNSDKHIKNKTLIEIGSTREISSTQDSSKYFHESSNQKGFNFITVDMDPENTKNLKKRFPGISAITQKGEEFLNQYSGIIDFLYIDAFDFNHGLHSEKRIDSYKKNLGTTINDSDCQKMHLDCARNCMDKISEKGIIVIDDCFGQNFEKGKGVTAIPFLLNNGFSLLKRNNQAIALQKT